MGTLYVVATPIGNLSDFSKRAIETLENCDYILAEDTRQTIKLLNYFNIKKKMVSYHKFNETKRSIDIIEDLKNGLNIALVSDAGTPCISDPGYILVKQARESGINIIGVSGPSAVITALSVSGLDTSSFSFYGFIPTDNKEKKELYKELKNSDIPTKVLYESPKRILKTLKELKEELPNSIVCVCCELTKIHEKSIFGKIDEVYEKLLNDPDAEKGEYAIVINNTKEEAKQEDLSIEALIIDEVIKNNCSIKEAVTLVSNKNNKLSKKDVYNASLNIKKILS